MINFFFVQMLAESSLLAISLILLMKFLGNFKVKKLTLEILTFPLLVFALGFALRLTDQKELIDTGFFLTDYSSLFVYLLFAACLVLGQLKYWKIK